MEEHAYTKLLLENYIELIGWRGSRALTTTLAKEVIHVRDPLTDTKTLLIDRC